ncbi:MAG: UDP-N-acetylmuramoyl-tripeptide--D-alanyl-D-alanine ligase [Mesorhizobium sp.]|nr:MAG: UDP-N-acetylmuramoyl-tripeptide--D-alanyl-D-alanine ligase [Mesorhizobium sp.]
MEQLSARAKRLLGLDRAGPLRSNLRRLKGKYRIAMARLRRRRTKATVIGITGSSAKTTTAELLAHILEGSGSVHKLTVSNTFNRLIEKLWRLPRNSAYAVMELGVMAKGDMARMASVLKPDIAIMTLIADEHHSAFGGRAAVAAEKQALVESLAPDGLAILNVDDDLIAAMALNTVAPSVTFGRSERARYRACDIHAAYPQRLSMTIHWPGGALALRTRLIAEHFWLAVAAAAAAALELGVDARIIAERVSTFEPMPTRCGVWQVREGPTFFVDTAKTPFHSLGLAFDMLGHADAGYKRVVLGHIADYAGKPAKAYGSAYRAARAICDQIVFVGEHAHRSGAAQEDRDSGRFLEMRSVRQVAEHVRATQRPDEVILVKGSRNLHLERIALAADHDVRCWEPVCGYPRSCLECGKYLIPFEQHREIRAAEKDELRAVRKRASLWRRFTPFPRRPST